MVNLSHSIQIFSDGSISSKKGGVYHIVKLDYEQEWSNLEFKNYKNSSRPTRNNVPYSDTLPSSMGLPATARFMDDTPVKFFKELQFYVHGLCSENSQQSETLNKKDFQSMWRDNAWMSNFAGTRTRADYINGNGLPPEIQLQPMACGGSLLKVVGEATIRQVPCWLVEAINPNINFKSYHPNSHPHLFFRPTISVRKWIKDVKGNVVEKQEWYSQPFHDYGENSVVPVFGFRYDIRSSTKYVNVIQKFRTKEISGQVPSPFIMRFGRKKVNPYEGIQV